MLSIAQPYIYISFLFTILSMELMTLVFYSFEFCRRFVLVFKEGAIFCVLIADLTLSFLPGIWGFSQCIQMRQPFHQFRCFSCSLPQPQPCRPSALQLQVFCVTLDATQGGDSVGLAPRFVSCILTCVSGFPCFGWLLRFKGQNCFLSWNCKFSSSWKAISGCVWSWWESGWACGGLWGLGPL